MKPGGKSMSMGEMGHYQLMIPPLQPWLRPGKCRHIHLLIDTTPGGSKVV
jgi:hypothetical protein